MPKDWTVHDLWAKYEDIAMHFNDLLIRLRTQALAGVAAISTLVSIFAKTDSNTIHISWEIATAVFILLTVFWAAIWAIDHWYYNRLLIGAVNSLLAIEQESSKQNPSTVINLSTKIEEYVAFPLDKRPFRQRFRSKLGIRAFYSLVSLALIAGVCFCYSQQ